ncbi:DUF1775 domain-containing protein [Streptomyces sp. NPDC001492]
MKTCVNAEYSVVVKQLPDAEELAFKTLQTYGDGHTDRWIELCGPAARRHAPGGPAACRRRDAVRPPARHAACCPPPTRKVDGHRRDGRTLP